VCRPKRQGDQITMSINDVQFGSDDEGDDFVPDLAVDVEDAKLDEEHVKRSMPKVKKVKKKKPKSSVDDIFAALKAADAASTKDTMSKAAESHYVKKKKKKRKSSSINGAEKGKDGKTAKKKKKKKKFQFGLVSIKKSSNDATDSNAKQDFWAKSKRRAELLAKARALKNSSDKVVISKTVNYAGKSTTVEKTVEAHSTEAVLAKQAAARVQTQEDKLDEVLGGLQGTKTISTVEKSSYDWDKFKVRTRWFGVIACVRLLCHHAPFLLVCTQESNKLDEELEGASRDGYLGKKDFLNRVDSRQFEQEKAKRDIERSKRLGSNKK